METKNTKQETGERVGSTDLLERNPATAWLNGQISIGKMCQLLGVQRHVGEMVAGAIWQAFDQRTRDLNQDIHNLIARSERDWVEAEKAEKLLDMTAESATKLAYQKCLNRIQLHIGSAIKDTEAAV